MTSISFLLSALAVLVGSAVYGSLGFGFAFVVIPVLSRVDPTMLPPTLWLLGIPFAVALLRREPGHADVPRAAYITAGKLVGTPVGAALITLVPKGRLDLVFAVALLAATGLTAIHREASPTARRMLLSAGVVSGVMGTAAALGGPPLTLALRGLSPQRFRATLAVCFVVGDLMSLVAMWLFGNLQWRHLTFAAVLAPVMVGGYFLSSRIIRRVDARHLRQAVLTFAVVSSILALVEGLRDML
ncbi:MAG TPA: sulfite exporter TauE/SafE family protein [Acidimicrobiia bacterium]|nr:sulfite exporter TauE/SafE family protein [Acidimicrobiia bacterium]